MNYIGAFFRIIRWPNLVFIALTQWLFYFFIAGSFILPGAGQSFADSLPLFYWLMLSQQLIAAAGYIINDYFDVNIDLINKPDRVVVEKFMKRRVAMFLHILFSLAGLSLSVYVALQVENRWIAIGNFICVLLLLFYSTTFKRKLLSGNLIIAMVIAWFILVVYFFAGGRIPDYHGFRNMAGIFDMPMLFLLTMTYAGFAFIITLVREVVKDLEDMEGDARYGCRTIPIVWGVPVAKTFCAVWMVVLASSLVIGCLFALQAGWWISALYIAGFIVLPLAGTMRLLKNASLPADYGKLSSRIKWITLAGIFSMVLFKFLA